MKKPSAKSRDEAAAICAVMASNPGVYWNEIGEALGTDVLSVSLAICAWSHAVRLYQDVPCDWRYPDAEAECLLREGWCP